MTDYQRKLYAFLQAFQHSQAPHVEHHLCATLQCLAPQLADLRTWWQNGGNICLEVAASSDRINLQTTPDLPDEVGVRHPISGQGQTITELPLDPVEIPTDIQNSTDAKHVFWWFWRFYPEYWAKANPNSQALLYPAHRMLPDCPLHSYQSTASALAGRCIQKGVAAIAQKPPICYSSAFPRFKSSSKPPASLWTFGPGRICSTTSVLASVGTLPKPMAPMR